MKVEIFRLIMEGARILILDEPTSILVPQESELLFQHIRKFAEMGHVIFLITHKIHPARAIASQVTVLRRGIVVGSIKVEALNDHELAELIL
jgi:simple sugar transport system ATP-binding protein